MSTVALTVILVVVLGEGGGVIEEGVPFDLVKAASGRFRSLIDACRHVGCGAAAGVE